tara:strand:- start:307 stop:459 length:153 start_codon:yes stop_codon:yes gene_type:complete
MARAKSLADPENREWKYILLLQGGGAYFADTMWTLVCKIFWGLWYDRREQ